jgi:hypothetical protein
MTLIPKGKQSYNLESAHLESQQPTSCVEVTGDVTHTRRSRNAAEPSTRDARNPSVWFGLAIILPEIMGYLFFVG